MATVGVFYWISESKIGLLQMIEFPLWAELLIAIMCLDLMAQYTVHYLLHKVSWMWKLHMVHHSDTKVDATTGTRHHPGDYLLREVLCYRYCGGDWHTSLVLRFLQDKHYLLCLLHPRQFLFTTLVGQGYELYPHNTQYA